METILTRALLVRQVNTGEADRVVTLITDELGKVSAIARGARKSRKRFGAALSFFVLGRAELQPRRSSDLHLLKSYEALEDFAGISRDLAAIAHGSYATEVVGELCPVGHPEPALFELLLEMYAYLASGPPRALVLRAFEQRALDIAGHGPQLEACVRCGRSLTPEAPGKGFDASRGGVLCGGCCHAGEGISREALAVLRDLGTTALNQPGGDPGPETATELRRVLTGCLLEVVGRPLRSIDFIRKLSS